jgi:hypothetical protein
MIVFAEKTNGWDQARNRRVFSDAIGRAFG